VGAAARFQRCRSASRLEVVIQINGCRTRRFDVCSTDSDGSRRGSTSTPGLPLPAFRKGRSSTAYHSLQQLGSTAAAAGSVWNEGINSPTKPRRGYEISVFLSEYQDFQSVPFHWDLFGEASVDFLSYVIRTGIENSRAERGRMAVLACVAANRTLIGSG
jgi:hypothetical protein